MASQDHALTVGDGQGDPTLAASSSSPFRCSAVSNPEDCGWPFCGCDPLANRVFEAIAEHGLHIVPERTGAPVGYLWTNKRTGNRELRTGPMHDTPFNRERWACEPVFLRDGEGNGTASTTDASKAPGMNPNPNPTEKT